MQGQLVNGDQRRGSWPIEARPQAVLADHQAHAGVFDDPLQALLRVVDIQRHIGGTGFHYRVEGHHHLQRTLQGDTYAHLWPHTLGNQVVGQTVGLRFQFGPGHLLVVADHRHHVRARFGLLAQLFGQQRRVRAGDIQAIIVLQALPLCRVQQRQIAKLRCRRVKHRQQQAFKAGANLFDSLSRKTVTQVQELNAQGGAEVDGQVHGEVGHVATLYLTKLQLALAGLTQALVDRVVLEDNDAVEQCLATQAGPALDIGQRGVLMVTDIQVVGLQLQQPVL
ncbi:hypothetical protein D3C79_583720 [compost metagenome]